MILIALLAVVLAGCGSGDSSSSTPAACLAPASAYLKALDAAPGNVRLHGATAISECVTNGQEGGELARVGTSVVQAATQLNAEARTDPGGDATVELGYLDGAINRGASETGGQHVDFVRRLDAAARFSEGGSPLPADFKRAFARGYSAGRRSG